MKAKIIAWLSPGLLLLLVACSAFTPRRDLEAEREAQHKMLLEREARRQEEERHQRTLQGMQDLDAEVLHLRNELDRVNREAGQAHRSDLSRLESRVAALERDLQALTRRQAQDKEEIIQTLSVRMAEVIAAQIGQLQAQRAAQPNAGGGAVHEVARGETLSAIAAAYGVSTSALMQANQIRDPNTLRVGQRLRIP